MIIIVLSTDTNIQFDYSQQTYKIILTTLQALDSTAELKTRMKRSNDERRPCGLFLLIKA